MLRVGHHPRWLQKQTPVRVFTHHKALVGAAWQDCAAAVIGFYNCDFGHYITIAHFPIMGRTGLASTRRAN